MRQQPIEYRSFAEAANAAPFDFFELAEPRPDHRWAGGYGVGRHGVRSLEVRGRIGTDDVSVTTHHLTEIDAGDRAETIEHWFRLLVEDVAWRSIMRTDIAEPLVLPLSIEIVGDDRELVVDGKSHIARGVTHSGSDQWAGIADVDDERFVVVRSSVVITSFTTCTDWSLLRRPPN